MPVVRRNGQTVGPCTECACTRVRRGPKGCNSDACGYSQRAGPGDGLSSAARNLDRVAVHGGVRRVR
jgi:hypothetical protein